MFRLAFCPIAINGKENLHRLPTLVFVANHASYLDAAILGSVLPANILLSGKKELADLPFFSMPIKKLGYIMLDRLDFSKSEGEVNLMSAKLQQGFSIVIFPEGTFTYAAGLRPFKLGAFKLAAETNTAICPIAIQGARTILPSGRWLPVRGPIKVSIGQPIMPQGSEWEDIIQLKSLARTEIAKHCGEPTLAPIMVEQPEQQT